MSRGKLSKHCHVRVKTQQNRAFQTSRSLRPSHNQMRGTSHPSTPRKPTLFDPIESDQTTFRLRGNQPRAAPARTIVPSTPLALEFMHIIDISLVEFCHLPIFIMWGMLKETQQEDIAQMCDSLYRSEPKLLPTLWKVDNLLAHVIENDCNFHYSREEKEEEIEKWLDEVEEMDFVGCN